MLQFRNWIDLEARAQSRSYDINDLKKRMRALFNDMRLFISDLPRGQKTPDPPDCELVFGGWSWKSRAFLIWRFYFSESRGFDFEPINTGIKVGKGHEIKFAGTRAAVEEARDRIIELLRQRNKFGTNYFDMEPFEVLRDLIREKKYHDVGGAPQFAKIYETGETQIFGVLWSMPDFRTRSILGRPLALREVTSIRMIDPDDISFLPAATILRKAKKAATRAKP